ncbi:MAG: flagellar hook-associated protein FlgL [Burkholderiaceae bacterium]
MNRIATLFAFERSLDAMNERRAALTQAQLQMSTGKRVNAPSDDPLGAAQAERARSQVARIGIERRMIDFARTMLGQADNAMASAGETLQVAREGLVAAGNGALSATDRALIAQKLRASRDELLTIANQRDGAGGYVFGGQGSTRAPFADSGALAWLPNAGEQATGADVPFTTSQDGRAVFMDLAAAGTSQSIFQTLDDAIALLENPGASGAAVTAGIGSALDGVDGALERVLVTRTRAGEQLRAIDARQRLLESGEIEASGRLSDLVDVDYASAITRFQQNQTALEAAMATYAKVARLSLFDFL